MTGGPAWTDTSLAPADRARAPVAALTLEQKVSQLHGNMETIDLYSIDPTDEDAANQFGLWRHVAGIDERGIPRMRVTNGPVGVGMGDGLESPPKARTWPRWTCPTTRTRWSARSRPPTRGPSWCSRTAIPWSCRGSTRCRPCWRPGTRAPRTGTSWPTCSSVR